MVGRTAPIGSNLLPRAVDERDALFCSTWASRFTGLGVVETAGLGVAAISECDLPFVVGCETDLSFCPSAARAPAERIWSSVGATDSFFLRGLGLVRSGAADSEGVCSDSEDGAACAGASGFAS